MKHLKLFEKFSARALSNTISFLKYKNLNTGGFLRDIKKLITHKLSIDKLSDNDFKYLPAKKAITLTSKSDDNNHSIKYWFSIEDGYLGSTLTKSVCTSYPVNMLVKYQDDFFKIGNVGNEKIVIISLNKKVLEVNPDEVTPLSKDEEETYNRLSIRKAKRRIKYQVERYQNEINNGSQFHIKQDNIRIIFNHFERVRVCLKYQGSYRLLEFEKIGLDWYLLSFDPLDEIGSWSSEAESSIFSWYKGIGGTNGFDPTQELDRIMAEGGMTLIDGSKKIMKTPDGKMMQQFELNDEHRIKSSDVTQDITNIRNRFKKKVSPISDKLLSITNGWSRSIVKKNDQTELVWFYKTELGAIYLVSDNVKVFNFDEENHLNKSYDREKYGDFSIRITDVCGRELLHSIEIDTLVPIVENTDKTKSDLNQKYDYKNFKRIGPSPLPNKADFALVLNIDVLKNAGYNFGYKQTSREVSKSGALAFTNDKTIRNERFEKYAETIIQRVNLNINDFNNMRFSNIVNNLLNGDECLFKIHGSTYEELNRMIQYLTKASQYMESGSEDIANDYIEKLKTIIRKIYTRKEQKKFARHIIDEYTKQNGRDFRIDILEKMIMVGSKINKKIKEADLKTLTDMEIFKLNLDKLYNTTRNVTAYKLYNLNDLLYSINAKYEGDSIYYMRHITEDRAQRLNKSLDNLSNYIDTINFKS